MKFFKQLFFLICAGVFISDAEAQVAPVPNPTMPSPAPQIPPATNPANTRTDTSTIRINPVPVQNQPNPGLNQQPFPKSNQDTLFRNIDTPAPGPFGTDSVKNHEE